MTVDFKPAPRIVDKGASKRKLLTEPTCRACGEPAANGHHLLGRAQRGDDCESNIIPVCGSGSMGCHGSLHGNPYVSRFGRRWEARDVRLAIGLALRPDEHSYVVQTLGWMPAASFLARNYHVRLVTTEDTFRMEEAT